MFLGAVEMLHDKKEKSNISQKIKQLLALSHLTYLYVNNKMMGNLQFLGLIVSVSCQLHVPVGVAQGDAEVPGNSQQCGAGDFNQSYDDHKDVDRSPAYYEDCNHHQHHAGDPTQIPVLLLFVCVCV